MKIAFWAPVSLPFHGNSDKEGSLGGSESALLAIAKELALLGHSVDIFNHCGQNSGTYNGVNYQDVQESTPLEIDHDICIFFRDVELCITKTKARKKVLWLHDDYSKFWLDEKKAAVLTNILTSDVLNTVFCISKWQGAVFRQRFGLPKEKIFYTRNGIDTSVFHCDPSIKRENQLIYLSMPNRGLDILLKIFPAIRKKLPSLQLKVCLLTEQEAKKNNLEQENVSFMGHLSKEKLAKELCKSKIYVYPNHHAFPLGVGMYGIFAECSCIAALEAQACGVPLITSKRGGLVDSVVDNKTSILIEGDVYTEHVQKKFIKTTVELLKNEAALSTMSTNAQQMMIDNYQWKQIAKEWEAQFQLLLNS